MLNSTPTASRSSALTRPNSYVYFSKGISYAYRERWQELVQLLRYVGLRTYVGRLALTHFNRITVTR
jgi:hypothetical protein